MTPLLVIFTLEYTQFTHTSKQIISHIYTQTDVQNYKTTDICRMYTVHIIKKYKSLYTILCKRLKPPFISLYFAKKLVNLFTEICATEFVQL